jgi:hypothetical protein
MENDSVRIWEIRLAPGERLLFHEHGRPYLWVCVAGASQLSRRGDGTTLASVMVEGRVYFSSLPDGAEVHSIENVGQTTIRYTTVEILAPLPGAPTRSRA